MRVVPKGRSLQVRTMPSASIAIKIAIARNLGDCQDRGEGATAVRQLFI